jgi:hypothetical protein
LDIDGFEHEITDEFVAHAIKNHGNEKIEKIRGQIALKESDFGNIPEIVKKPDIAIVGAKRKNENMVIYAKEMQDGTTLYFEEILSGKKTLRGKTMYKRMGGIDKEKLLNIITNREKTDVLNAKVIVGAGGYSGVGVSVNTDPTVATSAQADNSNIPQSANKSREIEIARKAGYVQGVCECVAAIGDNHILGKKLLTEMNVTKDTAKKYAKPETFKKLEQGIFAPKPEQKQEQTHSIKR